MSRWKIMACMLSVSLGGLAICAGQSNDKTTPPVSLPSPTPTDAAPVMPVATKPMSVPDALETRPPLPTTAPQFAEIELIVPEASAPVGPLALVPQMPMATFTTEEFITPEILPLPRVVSMHPVEITTTQGYGTSSAIPSDLTPIMTVPVAQLAEPLTPPMVETPLMTTESVPAPPSYNEAPRVNELSRVQQYDVPQQQATPPAYPQAPVPDFQSTPLPPLPPMPPLGYVPPVQPLPPTIATPPMSKLKLLMRLGDGRPRFEIRNSTGEDLLFKVYGEKVEMQAKEATDSPISGVSASGKVRFTGPGIEGTCDKLLILSGTGEVLLNGNINMKTKTGKNWSEMKAETMIYRIGANGLSTAPSPSPIVPVNYSIPR